MSQCKYPLVGIDNEDEKATFYCLLDSGHAGEHRYDDDCTPLPAPSSPEGTSELTMRQIVARSFQAGAEWGRLNHTVVVIQRIIDASYTFADEQLPKIARAYRPAPSSGAPTTSPIPSVSPEATTPRYVICNEENDALDYWCGESLGWGANDALAVKFEDSDSAMRVIRSRGLDAFVHRLGDPLSNVASANPDATTPKLHDSHEWSDPAAIGDLRCEKCRIGASNYEAASQACAGTVGPEAKPLSESPLPASDLAAALRRVASIAESAPISPQAQLENHEAIMLVQQHADALEARLAATPAPTESPLDVDWLTAWLEEEARESQGFADNKGYNEYLRAACHVDAERIRALAAALPTIIEKARERDTIQAEYNRYVSVDRGETHRRNGVELELRAKLAEAEAKLAIRTVTRCQKCGAEALPSPTHALDLEYERDVALEELSELRTKLAEAARESDKANRRITAYMEDMAAHRAKLTEAEARIADLDTRLVGATALNVGWEARAVAAEAARDAAVDTCTEAEMLCEQLRAENARLASIDDARCAKWAEWLRALAASIGRAELAPDLITGQAIVDAVVVHVARLAFDRKALVEGRAWNAHHTESSRYCEVNGWRHATRIQDGPSPLFPTPDAALDALWAAQEGKADGN